MLKGNGESGHFCLVPNFRGNILNWKTLEATEMFLNNWTYEIKIETVIQKLKLKEIKSQKDMEEP